MACRMTGGVVAAMLTIMANQSEAKVVTKPCDTAQQADTKKFATGDAFPPGQFVFVLKRATRFNVTLVGGGGGGGGTPPGADHPRWAAGGFRAGFVRSKTPLKLLAGRYLIDVGEGGAGSRGTDWKAPPVAGNDGGATAIRKCPSLDPILSATGGRGALAEGVAINWNGVDRAGDGEDMFDTDTNERIGTGGRGGIWQQGGGPARGNGAGGGGEGAVTRPDQASGTSGSDGFARIVRVK